MPSVIATWSGRCQDEERRRALLARIEDLAQFVDALLESPVPYIRYDGVIRGRIVAARDLFPEHAVALEDPRLARVDEVAVEGIEFRLADARNLYPGDDRVSFVFASVGGAGDGTGVLVRVEDAEQCRGYVDPAIQEADYFLCAPRIHLRYFAEEWLDRLLSFVRRFHLPELDYWRHEDLPQADLFDAIACDDAIAREEAWRSLKSALIEEASSWKPLGRELRARLDYLLRGGAMPMSWVTETYAPLQVDLALSSSLERLLSDPDWRTRLKAAARDAILGAGKGLAFAHIPLAFQGLDLSLASSLDPTGRILAISVRIAPADAPQRAIALDEIARDPD